MDLKAWLTLAGTLLTAVVGATVTLATSLGRRQRLRLALDVQDGISSHQQAAWKRMIERDTASILRSSERSIVLPLYLAGAATLVYIALFPVENSTIKNIIVVAGLAMEILAVFIVFYRAFGRRREVKELKKQIVAADAEIAAIRAERKAEKEAHQAEMQALRTRKAELQNNLSRGQYDLGAPMSVVRAARSVTDVDDLPNLASHWDTWTWRLRRAYRKRSPFRERLSLNGRPLVSDWPKDEQGPGAT